MERPQGRSNKNPQHSSFISKSENKSINLTKYSLPSSILSLQAASTSIMWTSDSPLYSHVARYWIRSNLTYKSSKAYWNIHALMPLFYLKPNPQDDRCILPLLTGGYLATRYWPIRCWHPALRGCWCKVIGIILLDSCYCRLYIQYLPTLFIPQLNNAAFLPYRWVVCGIIH